MDNKKPLVSVIIPIYNAEEHLERCLVSVMNQSYANLEIVLVDDGSTDSSFSICTDYSKIDKRIKVIHKENEGAAAARNTGLDNLEGEYITFVDSDDLIGKNMIEKLYDGAIRNGCDISACGFWTCYENSIIDFNKKNQNITETVFNESETLNIFGWSEKVASNSVWGKLFKKEIFENVRFPAIRTAEDLFVAFKLYHNARKIYVTDEQLYYYIIRKGSLMHGEKLNTDDTILTCDMLIDYCNFCNENEYRKRKMIALLLKIKADTILEDYYYAVKRKIDRSELKHINALYYKMRPQLKEQGAVKPQYRVFEFSPFLFCVCVEIYYALIGRNRIRLE